MVYILLADGFEETESVVPCDLLRRAEVETKLVGVSGKRIVSSHGIAVEADMLLDEAAAQLPEMVVLPGGRRGVENLLASEQTLALVRQTWEAGKYVAAICAAPTVLAALGISSGRCATCYPGMEDRMADAKMTPEAVVIDGRLITGRAAGSSMAFGLALVGTLCGEQTANRIAQGVVYSC